VSGLLAGLAPRIAVPRFLAMLAVPAVVHLVALWYVRVPELAFGLIVAPFGFADVYAMWWLHRGLHAYAKLQ
jgi:hypothetical protein